MSEPLLLQQIIDNAIGEYCVQNGGGFPVAYMVVVEMMDADGSVQMVMTAPPDQPTYRSMGLAAYAEAWAVYEAQNTWTSVDIDSDED